ncbi:hypothetical protein [Amycolatopsis eburnea]|uniref:hypothetical protein n=1 Tax=Amycolatopsis eburnea TaxID=2267691 RepID=UPI00131533E6|nr:hypothetical protein [Amycolatopsis eburnea]
MPAGRTAAEVLAGYRTEIEASDAAIRAADGPDRPLANPVQGTHHTLLDGVTGR